MKRIYVGNLSYQTTEDGLRSAFEPFGEVLKVDILTDRDTGRLRGFGFVEMAKSDEGDRAIAGLNGKDFEGRALTVNEARPREQGAGGGYGGGSGRQHGSRW